jgi:energy-coupling factor transporter ATP-binding protein EcfA2
LGSNGAGKTTTLRAISGLVKVKAGSSIQFFGEELAGMSFLLSARPILSDEGAVRVITRYPEQLRGRPFTVLINNMVVENLAEEWILREGEHHLAVVSEDYRNESRRFVVERTRTVDLVIDLQDPTPLIFFEAPQNTQIFLNNSPIFRGNDPIPVEPGVHEARFHVGDHTITRTITVQRGSTYRIALTVGIDIQESD